MPIPAKVNNRKIIQIEGPAEIGKIQAVIQEQITTRALPAVFEYGDELLIQMDSINPRPPK